jgi:hypothetical protein
VAEYYVQGQLPADGGFSTAMTNLATATSADRETVATLTKAITTLNDQLEATDILAKSKEAEIKRLLGRGAPALAVVADVPGVAYVSKSYKTKNGKYC